MLINPMIISTKCIDLLLCTCTFKTGHLLLIMMGWDWDEYQGTRGSGRVNQ